MEFTKNDLLKKEIASKKSLQIKLLGDSITHGVGGSGYSPTDEHIVGEFKRNNSGYCWANKFKEYIKENFASTVINNGCSGTTIEFIIKYFNELVDESDDFIICTIGTNNRHQYFCDGSKLSREEMCDKFYSNIIKLHSMIKALNKPVIFMANIPASKENEQDGESYWRILHMDDINNIYKKASAECDFPLISLYDLFSDYCVANEKTLDEFLLDGLHPNDKGYDVMFNLIINALELNRVL